MADLKKASKISHSASKYLNDTWANFVSWQANIKLGSSLFAQSRIDIKFIEDDKNSDAKKIVDRNMTALEVYVRGKNNFGEMIFCRIMDDFEYYLFDVSFRALKNNTYLLHTKEGDKYSNEVVINLSDILDNIDSVESILYMTLSKKLDSVKRNQGGYEGLVRFIEKKIINGKDILKKDDYKKLKKYYALRCLFTHSGGIIDNQFVKSFPEYKLQLGQKYAIEDDNVMNARSEMNLIIVAIDARMTHLLSENDLVEENYMQAMIESGELMKFSEIIQNKIAKLISEDDTQSKTN